MKTLYEKIIEMYPSLTQQDFCDTIRLQNNSDGLGDYIAAWTHPVYARPTSDQLAESNPNEELA